jgi:dienelactone hydrolase
MPTVLARGIYLGAALVLGVSLFGIRAGTRDVAHQAVTLPGGIPAIVYEPGPMRGYGESPPTDSRYPVVILAHGFAANKGVMGVLARRLARAGYAVVTFDFRGHGMNRAPLESGRSGEGLYEDLEAAVWYAATRPHFDVERLVLAGHSMGAGAVLGYAAREPGAAAVVAISGGGATDGPYDIPNPLLIWASGDPQSMRTRLRAVGARLAGLERLVLDRLYGDRARGTAVRITEVDGTDHVTILYSREAARRIVAWLDESVGPFPDGRRPPGGDGRLIWVALGLLSALVLVFGATRLLGDSLPPSASPPRPASGPSTPLLELVGGHAIAVVGLAAFDPEAGGGTLSVLPVRAGEELAAFFLLSGLGFLSLLLIRGALPPRVGPRASRSGISGSFRTAFRGCSWERSSPCRSSSLRSGGCAARGCPCGSPRSARWSPSGSSGQERWSAFSRSWCCSDWAV